MRIRFALSLGALLLAGGAIAGGIASAAPAPTAPQQATTAPAPVSGKPSAQPAPEAPTEMQKPGVAPRPAPAVVTPGKPRAARVPTAIPAGPTGDLHLPAIWG
ncbi:MAG TPA: hypothetical protein VGH57_04665 [Amycolatopsis sp.]